MWIYSVYNSLEDSVSLLILIVVHRRSVLCWCWRDVFSHVLVSGYPSFPLAAAPRLSLLHLVYLCSHSGENTVHNLEDESDSHILSIFKAFFFPTFLPFCCSSYMMKRLFGKSDLETRCGYWFQLQSHSWQCQLCFAGGKRSPWFWCISSTFWLWSESKHEFKKINKILYVVLNSMDIAKKCIRTHDIFFLRHSHFLQYQKSQPTANYVKINKAINFATYDPWRSQRPSCLDQLIEKYIWCL